MKLSARDWVMLMVLSCLWGTSYYLIEIALEGLPVLTLVAIRIAMAAVILWAWVLLRGHDIPSSPRVWLSFLTMGVLNNIIPFSLIVWGQTEITSSLAAILNATTPLFAVVVAAMFLHDEPVSRGKVAAVVVGFVGVVVMIGPGVTDQVGTTSLLAQAAVVGAALSYAFASVYGRRFHAMGFKPSLTAACQVSVSAVLLGAYVFVTDGFGGILSAGAAPWAAVTSLAVFSTAIAYILYFRLLASAGAVNLMLVTFMMPAVSILLGFFLLDERLDTRQIVGMLIIGAALVLVDGRLLSRRRKPI